MERVVSMPPAATASKAGKQPSTPLEHNYADWVGTTGMSEYFKGATSLAARLKASTHSYSLPLTPTHSNSLPFTFTHYHSHSLPLTHTHFTSRFQDDGCCRLRHVLSVFASG